MRSFGKLSRRGKLRRIRYSITGWLKRNIVGSYMRGGIKGAYHWVRCHTVHRYGIINLAKYSNGEYTWGWIDRDDAMLLACFHLLCDFVENEDPEVGTRTLDDYRDKDHEWYPGEREVLQQQLDWDAEIRALYDWWKHGRAKEHKEAEADVTYQRLRDTDARDEEMLIRLMKVRGALWT